MAVAIPNMSALLHQFPSLHQLSEGYMYTYNILLYVDILQTMQFRILRKDNRGFDGLKMKRILHVADT